MEQGLKDVHGFLHGMEAPTDGDGLTNSDRKRLKARMKEMMDYMQTHPSDLWGSEGPHKQSIQSVRGSRNSIQIFFGMTAADLRRGIDGSRQCDTSP